MSDTEAPRYDLIEVVEGPRERVEVWAHGKRRYVRVERLPATTEPTDHDVRLRLRRSEVELLAQFVRGDIDYEEDRVAELLWSLNRTVVIGCGVLVAMGGKTVREGDE